MSRTIFEPFSASWLSFFGCAAVLVGAYRALNSCKRRRRHSKKGFSEHQLSWTSKVIYKTAWFVAHRIDKSTMTPNHSAERTCAHAS